MRITYLSESVFPSKWASSVHAIGMVSALAKLGHDVFLVGFSGKHLRKVDFANLLFHYGNTAKFSFSLMPSLPWSPVKKIVSFLYGTVFMFRPCDLVISRNLYALLPFAAMGHRFLIEHHHFLSARDGINSVIFEWLISRKSFLGLIVVTESLRNAMETEWPALKECVHAIPDAAGGIIGRQEFALAAQSREARLQVGYLGQFFEGKGVSLVAMLAAMCPDFAFHVVGGDEKSVQNARREHSSLSNLHFYGFVPHASTGRFLQLLDVALLPNQQKVIVGKTKLDIGGWTSPLKLFEYMAAGLPIVASNLEVLREVLEDDKNCILSKPDDIEEWVRALHRLSDDPTLRGRLGSNARQEFLAKYTWERRAMKVLGVFLRNA